MGGRRVKRRRVEVVHKADAAAPTAETEGRVVGDVAELSLFEGLDFSQPCNPHSGLYANVKSTSRRRGDDWTSDCILWEPSAHAHLVSLCEAEGNRELAATDAARTKQVYTIRGSAQHHQHHASASASAAHPSSCAADAARAGAASPNSGAGYDSDDEQTPPPAPEAAASSADSDDVVLRGRRKRKRAQAAAAPAEDSTSTAESSSVALEEGEEEAEGAESSDEGTSDDEAAGAKGRAGFDTDTDDDDTDTDEDDGGVEDEGEDADADEAEPTPDMLCGIPATRYYLPPDPTRQPHLALVCLKEGDPFAFAPKGLNLRVKPLLGAATLMGGLLREGEWGTIWGGEGENLELRCCSAAQRVRGAGGSGGPQHANTAESSLLLPPPRDEEYKWAVSRTAALQEHAAIGAPAMCCLLISCANRSALLGYLHSFHAQTKQQVLGPILSRLQCTSAGAAGDDAQDSPPVVPPPALAALLRTPDDVGRNFFDAASRGEGVRIAVVGAANSGKSTVCKLLTNSLGAHERAAGGVVYLDTDLGQPEFTPPGCVSLTLVKSVVTGPSYAHVAEAKTSLSADSSGARYEVRRSVFLGDVTPQADSFAYCRGVASLLQHYAEDASLRRLPLVVNTHGWTTGLGLRCLSELLQRVHPHCIVNTGGLGTQDASDGGAQDTQASRALALLRPSNGISQAYLAYFEAGGCVTGEVELCGPYPLSLSTSAGRCVVVDAPLHLGSGGGGGGAPPPVASKGWWSRQALLTTAICGAAFNTYCRAMATHGAGTGHALVRSFFASSRPYVLPLSRVCVYVHGAEWETSLRDACPLSALPAKLERRVVALYNDPELCPREDGEEDSVTIGTEPPSFASEFVGYGFIPATDASSIYLLTSVDPVALSRVNAVSGCLEAPSAWFADLTQAAASSAVSAAAKQPVGKTKPAQRQGKEKKLSRVYL